MNRQIIQVLKDWKKRANRKPLIVRGARQVGKTYAIEEFAVAEFENYIKLNLEERPDCKKLFHDSDVLNIVSELSVLFNQKIIPEKTLLFIDEIQTCPEAILALRYFKEKMPNLHVIAAGSLLDHTLNEMNYSMPVGRVEFCYMYPMSFKEFLWAIGEEAVVNYIEAFNFKKLFSETIHKQLLKYVRTYFFIGGMPEVVKTYIENKNDYSDVERIQSSIITSFQYDFAKYGTKTQLENLLKVLRYCGNNIGKKIKYSNIDRDSRSTNLKEAIKKLEYSRIVHLIKHTQAGKIPLSNHVKDEIYKPLFMDIGLANHLSGIQLVDIENLLTAHEGTLAEQFIGQELLANTKPYLDPTLYYWTREEKNSNAEIDFLYQHHNTIYPIEVKAGKGNTLKSLHVYLFEKKLKMGIRFNTELPNTMNAKVKVQAANKNEELVYNLLSLPIYLCSELERILSRT